MSHEGPCNDPLPDRLTSVMCTRCAYPMLEHDLPPLPSSRVSEERLVQMRKQFSYEAYGQCLDENDNRASLYRDAAAAIDEALSLRTAYAALASAREADAREAALVIREEVGKLYRIASALCSTVPDPAFPPRMNREARHRIAKEADIADGQCKGFAVAIDAICKRLAALATQKEPTP